MQSLYSNEIRNYIRTRDWPKYFQWEVHEYPEYLQFVVFQDNYESYTGEHKLQIAMCIKQTMEKIRADGIPIYLERKETQSERG